MAEPEPYRDPLDEPEAPIRLVVQGRQTTSHHGPLMALARTMGLDVWGNHLLGRRVSREMGAASLVLATVVIFEFVAWTMLFNVFVHSAQWMLSPLTLLAAVLGLLFSSAVYVFERGFITADFSEGAWLKRSAYVIRLVVIAGSALATAQPLELLVFGGAIQNRLHQENVLAEAVRRVEDYEQLQSDAEGMTYGQIQHALEDTRESRSLEQAQVGRDTAEKTVRDLKRQLDDADHEVGRWQGSEGYWKTRFAAATTSAGQDFEDPEEKELVRAELDKAKRNLAYARRMLGEATEQQRSITRRLAAARNELPIAETKLGAAKKAWEQLVQTTTSAEQSEAQAGQTSLDHLKNWIKQLQASAPGNRIEDETAGFSLEPRRADFTERLRVLDDLRHGRPPLWPRTSPETRERAKQAFSLDAWVSESAAGPGDGLVQRLAGNARLFNRIYRVAFIVALVIPLLTFAFKLLMPRELRDYYSLEAQARDMNPEAIQAWLASGRTLDDLKRPEN